MPHRLKELADSFETIIIRYLGPVPNAYVVNVDCDSEEVNTATLEEHINSMTEVNNKCSHRASLMHYLLYGVNLIHNHYAHQKPLNKDVANKLQQELTQMIVDLHQITGLSKNRTIEVKYNETRARVNGCMENGGSVCKSGKLVQEILFSNGVLTLKSTQADIEKYVIEIFKAQQYELFEEEINRLEAENISLKLDLKQKDELFEEEIKRLEAENISLKLDLKYKDELLSKADDKIETLQVKATLPTYDQATVPGFFQTLFKKSQPASLRNRTASVVTNNDDSSSENGSRSESECESELSVDEMNRRYYDFSGQG